MDIKSFDSNEEFVSWLEEQRAKVQERTLDDAQRAIKYGHYAIRFMENLVIFAFVEPVTGEPADVMAEYERKDRDENMLFCKCFSTIVRDGEYGWLHRSVLWPIRQVDFDMAGGVGWEPSRFPAPVTDAINDAWFGMRMSAHG